MCRVAEYNRVCEEIKKLEAVKTQMACEFMNYFATTGEEKIMAEDGVHYIRYYKAQEPKYHEARDAYWDNGKSAYCKYH